MTGRYRDRVEAGGVLAGVLRGRLPAGAGLVLALPRGGVPVAFAVARELDVPLDVFVVRKLGVPGQPELAFGAIASGGAAVMNDDVVSSLRLTPQAMFAVREVERAELARREEMYRAGRGPLEVRGRHAVLVDDGLATGASMRAAVKALKALSPASVTVAVPVAPPETVAALAAEVDDVVCPLQPREFYGVGQWYADFSQTTDDEVRALLARAQDDATARTQEE